GGEVAVWAGTHRRGASRSSAVAMDFPPRFGADLFFCVYSLLFQIKGLIGSEGILPAREFLAAVPNLYPGLYRFWFAPTLLWFSSSNHMLMLVCWLGLVASVVVVLNLCP